MDTKSKKTSTIAVVAAVVVAVAVFAIVRASKKNSSGTTAGQTADKTTLNDIVPADQQATSTASTTPATGGKAATLSAAERYQQALAKYPFRIQFSEGCHGTTGLAGNGIMVIKKGTSLMLDNQDNVTRTIAFKDHSYRVPAHDFVIGTVTAVGDYPVTCNGAGAAELRVEP